MLHGGRLLLLSSNTCILTHTRATCTSQMLLLTPHACRVAATEAAHNKRGFTSLKMLLTR